MANEIVALEQTGAEIGVLFLFPVAAPHTIGGANVVPTPSAGLPAVAVAALAGAELAALDAGTLAFTVHTFSRQGIAGAPLLAKVQALYALRLAEFTADYAARYALAGNRYNA